MISVDQILKLHKDKVEAWHTEVVLTEELLPFKFIEENHHFNFSLWHEEDIARVKDIDPLRIVEAKRNIDKYNQARNNAMEKIDEWILLYLQEHNIPVASKQHSETPGMMIDRLSIMSLKHYHMYEETIRPDANEQHKANCAAKVAILDEQIADLAKCLEDIFAALEGGVLKFKVYRQLKMYNDPTLNPQLYKNKQA
ncbi:DUF4254 domain-containing protein [Flavobacterium sp. RNTU_13]|uniref:DUF4254 domain-containing protein n=1 Tax=Flavobacterium sp. RNTU_13 TaxID=3375145 RepID=UPI0039866D41